MIRRRDILRGFCTVPFLHLGYRRGLAHSHHEHRFICILLRGGADALDIVRPEGDRDLKRLRTYGASSGSIDMDGFFAFHPGAQLLHTLYKQRHLSIAHAVATPYRLRSHFEAQDVLEIGGSVPNGSSGWLNRLVNAVPGLRAVDIGPLSSKILQGSEPVDNWYPELELRFTDEKVGLLRELYSDNEAFSRALERIHFYSAAGETDFGGEPGVSPIDVAGLAGNLLHGDARIAAFSIDGWDTHAQQEHRLTYLLDTLGRSLLRLRQELGTDWEKTAVAICTEFGRTARFNGSKGTDHGTGGLVMFSGGLVEGGMGGKVTGKWPGLSVLYEDRDLQPTSDVRSYIASVCTKLYNVPPSQISSVVFPGLDTSYLPPVI